MKRGTWWVGWFTLAVALAPMWTEAAVLRIWPHQLKNAREQYLGGDTAMQLPDGTGVVDDPSPVHYYAWAPIVLPVGSTISKVTCYYRSDSGTGEMYCSVYRRAWGKKAEEIYHCLAAGAVAEYTQYEVGWWGGDKIFHDGYVHYVLVVIKKPAFFGGLRIAYTAP